MTLKAGTAFVDIQPQVGAGFQAGIASRMGPVGAVAGVALAASVGAAFAGGAALLKVDDVLGEAFDAIRVGTGATGPQLEELNQSFREVFSTVPTDAGAAGQALADLNTRTGAVGETLEELTATSLNLGRITGEDVGGLIEKTTRTFGDWGIAVEDGTGALDALFRASQATGPPVSRLSDLLTRYGAPLRQFGFGFEESAALLGKFEQEGVNTELVMGSLRVALGKVAREGGDPAQALEETIEAIQTAGSVGEANALALELFGARAGPDMAAAIREGRFELGELFAQVASGDETIASASGAVDGFREKWQTFKNRVLVAIEPLAIKFEAALGSLLDTIGPAVGPVLEGITNALSAVGDLFGGVSDGATGLASTVGPILTQLRDYFAAAFGLISDVFGDLVAGFEGGGGDIGGVLEGLAGVFQRLFEVATTIFNALREFWDEWGGLIVALIVNAWETITGVISGAFDIITGLFDVVLGILTGDWSRAWEGIKSIVSGAWQIITSVVSGFIGQVRAVIAEGLANVSANVSDRINGVVGFFAALPGRVLSAVGNLVGLLRQLGADLVAGLVAGLGNIAPALTAKLRSGISDAISSVKRFFGISSPSKVFASALGLPLAQGTALGAEAVGPLTAAALTAGLTDAARQASKVAPAQLAAITSANRPTAGATTQPAPFDAPSGGGFQLILEAGAVTITNPTPEPASVTLPRELRRLASTIAKA